MITKRDLKVIDFINEFHVAHTSTINELFYSSLRVAQNRLAKLCEMKELNRERYHFTQEYIYYKKKPVQLRHELLLTEFYRELSYRLAIKYKNNIKFKKEFNKIEGIRPDGLVGFVDNHGKSKIYFIEVEISKKGLDLDKYDVIHRDNDYWKDILPVFPDLIVITDNNIKNNELNKLGFKVYRLSTDFIGEWDFI